MPQGHTLGPPRASARVQYQGYVVSRGLGYRNSHRNTRQANVALLAHFRREHRDLAVRGCAAREFSAYRGQSRIRASVSPRKKRNSS